MAERSSPLSSASALYQGASGRTYHDQKRALSPPALPWVLELRAGKFQPHVRPTDVVFELGVGSGWNLARLRCARKIGCDTAEFLAERVQELGIEFIPDPATVPGDTADVAICHQTLEHLLEPAQAMAELARILKPDGKLVLHVPWERERRYRRYRPEEPNHHLFNWNAQNLGNFASVTGFRSISIRVRRYGYDRFSANLSARLHLGRTGFRVVRALMIALRPFYEVELVALAPNRG